MSSNPLNPAGSDPIVNFKFGGLESGTCTFFFKKSGVAAWTKIATINNDTFASHNIVLNPAKYLGDGSTVADLVNADFRYNLLFLDKDGDGQITCSFDLEITQDGVVIHSESDGTLQNVASILLTNSFSL
jgi:hypothetical protein